MNKVTTINLNGNAYQLEEGGYELLKKYLNSAQKNLADDPDRDEILADFERAIAEKCDSHLNSRKNVVTEKEVAKIIEDMGPVEPTSESEQIQKASKQESAPPIKRLYTLPDGAMIGGVANGLAAYLNVDVTIIRLVFVLLIFVTSGLWILIYLLMMVVLPEAHTPEQKAELRGEEFSAQHVLDQARQKYANIANGGEHLREMASQTRPLLANIGSTIERVVQFGLVACGFIGSLLILALTVLWATGLSWLIFSHPHFPDQLSTISHWTIGAAMTAAYFLVALPLATLAMWLIRVGLCRPLSRKGSVRWLIGVAGLWFVAAVTLATVMIVTGQRVHDYYETNGMIVINHHKECINTSLCWGASNGVKVENSSGDFVCRKTYCKWGPNGGDFQRVTHF